MKGTIINFSGHNLCLEAKTSLRLQFDELVEADWPEFDFNECLGTQLQAAISAIPIAINGETPLTIIPPGQSTLAILLISFLHGIIGHFPQLCYLERNSTGLYLPKFQTSISCQDIRVAGRRFRLKNRSTNA